MIQKLIMKAMKFRGFKAQMILEGTKTSSLRLFDDKNLTKEDDLELINFDTGQPFAYAKITEIIEKPLGEITDQDLIGHESFGSKEDMYASLRKYYTDVDATTPAKIVRFKVVAKS